MYYGVIGRYQVFEFIRQVCFVLDHGINHTTEAMLLETCAQETQLGGLRDRHAHAMGVGLFQMDNIAFTDVQLRVRAADRQAVLDAFGFDVHEVEYRELAYSPLLSTVFARLFYKLIPDPFPADRRGRAEYWKRFYNTAKGAGSVSEYMANADVYCPLHMGGGVAERCA